MLENKLPTSCRSRTSSSHRRLSLLSRGSFSGAGDPDFAALLRGDDERRGAGGGRGRGRRLGDICVVDVVAVVLGGEAVVRLPAVALVLPLLGGQDAARLLHRVVVRLLDLRLHVVEVLCVCGIIRRQSATDVSLLMLKMT